MTHIIEDILITSLLYEHFTDWLDFIWETWRNPDIKSLLTNHCFYIVVTCVTSLHDCFASIFNKNTLMTKNLQILTLKFRPCDSHNIIRYFLKNLNLNCNMSLLHPEILKFHITPLYQCISKQLWNTFHFINRNTPCAF